MKALPILFSGAMVRAIQAGTKTQTRRVVKMHPDCHSSDDFTPTRDGIDLYCEECPEEGTLGITCPYGAPGDRLWVRETWSQDALTLYPCPKAWYAASDDLCSDGIHSCPAEHRGRWADCLACWEQRHAKFRWRPSIHMRRELSRITLEIVSVRVERLQAISLGDICREGLAKSVYDFKPATAGFGEWAKLWNSIKRKPHATWEANPWVWVVDFKRVEGGA